MDPVEQTLAQGRTQNSPENFADYYAKGRQLAQQDTQLSLSQQHLVLQQQQQQIANAQAPLINAHMALTNENQITKNKVDLLTLNNLTDQNAAVPDFLQLENRFMQSPDGFQDKGLWEEAIKLGQKYPGAAVKGGPLANLIDLGKADVMAKQSIKTLLNAQEHVNGTGLHFSIIDLKTGRVGLANDVRDTAQSPLGRLQSDRAAAIDRGDFESAAEFDKVIDAEHTKLFAPTDPQKNWDQYQLALKGGDPKAIKFWEGVVRKASSAGSLDTLALKAKIKVINDDLRMSNADKNAAIDKLINENQDEDAGATAPPALPRMQTKIPVIAPDGKRGFVPADQLDQAIKEGYRKAP